MKIHITPHECFVGVLNDYDNTEMVTLNGLKHHIEYFYGAKAWTLVDYCNKRKSTDLTRFEYCPACGKKIDWKTIKNE